MTHTTESDEVADRDAQQLLMATRLIVLTIECANAQFPSLPDVESLGSCFGSDTLSGPDLDARDFASRLYKKGWRVAVTGASECPETQALCPFCAGEGWLRPAPFQTQVKGRFIENVSPRPILRLVISWSALGSVKAAREMAAKHDCVTSGIPESSQTILAVEGNREDLAAFALEYYGGDAVAAERLMIACAGGAK